MAPEHALTFDPTDPVALTQALVRCPSVTPDAGSALDLLEAVLGPAGFTLYRLTLETPGTPPVENLYARRGMGAPHLSFAGHVDVVPPGDVAAWSHDPFSGAIVDGTLYGRGTTDMKGGVAASVSAALRFLAAKPDFGGSISFIITGDEEGPAVNGTVQLVDWMRDKGERPDHCLLGEPTNPGTLGEMIKIGRRGSLTGRLTVQGTQGHVAYPHLADNPIRGLVRILDAVMATPLDQGTPHFSASNLEFTTVDVGNTATNVIPASARAVFNIRFNDLWTPETLESEIRRRVAAAAGNTVRHEVTFEPTNSLAFLTEPDRFVDTVRAAIAEVTGVTPVLSTTGGTSDARFIKTLCPVLEFGLVGKTMHQVNENVPVAELETLTRIYGEVLERYFR